LEADCIVRWKQALAAALNVNFLGEVIFSPIPFLASHTAPLLSHALWPQFASYCTMKATVTPPLPLL
jgi:hypothetical protein